ncbi:hypothetical protein ACHHYP_20483 [Achlya hypogyna]|uniref:Biogenesis of lysosome-related organelles complex 1 subunit 6 n=1 Tax=Achlya hypogyna TaxID=1202772 RepID=A0A1V9YL63_ACHHY|nr:hypothetical protein ACHHYP_20483 [Achlya hypogyna]
MAEKAGKIVSGEGSESEDEEEDEPMWVPTIAPKAPIVEKAPIPPPSPATMTAPTGPADAASSDNSPEEHAPVPSPILIPTPAQATPLASPQPTAPVENDPWHETIHRPFTEAEGVAKMSLAAASKLQSVLDGTLEQITDLVDSQEHLLTMITERNGRIVRNSKIAAVEQTMSQAPVYFQKVVALKARMAEITQSMERMKKQAEYLQVEAQSRAIAKEDARDKMSQWNKLLSAKPSTDLQRKMDESAPRSAPSSLGHASS